MRSMMPTALLVVALTTSCATPDGSAANGPPDGGAASDPSPREVMPSAPSAPSAEPPLSSTVLPTITPPTEPPRTPTDQVSPITVAGTVEHGIEAGCLVLVAAETGVTYDLAGPMVKRLEVGSTAKVRGLPLRGSFSVCQQGVPLRVGEILPS